MKAFLIILIPALLSLQNLGFTHEDNITTGTRKIIVYYFHGDIRCNACLNIERYTKETVRANFGKEITSGSLELKIVNFDKAGNEHYPSCYQLSSPSVILSDLKNGREVRWKNLGKIWDYETDKDSFVEYIRKEIADFIKYSKSDFLIKSLHKDIKCSLPEK